MAHLLERNSNFFHGNSCSFAPLLYRHCPKNKEKKTNTEHRNPKLMVFYSNLWNIKKTPLQLIYSFLNYTGCAWSRRGYRHSLTCIKLIFKHHQRTQRTGSYAHLLHGNLCSSSVNIFWIQMEKKQYSQDKIMLLLKIWTARFTEISTRRLPMDNQNSTCINYTDRKHGSATGAGFQQLRTLLSKRQFWNSISCLRQGGSTKR